MCLSRFRCTVTRNIIPFNLDFVFTELFSVKCPRGMKYDMTQKDCLACPIGYTSEQESSLNCTKCPEKKSTRKEGSKTCEGKHDAVGQGAIFNVVLSFSSLSIGLFVCFCFNLFPFLVEIVFP